LTTLSSHHLPGLYIYFPTKALTHDQQEKIMELVTFNQPSESVGIQVCVYDGDTPTQKRQFIRQSARCLLTNPDMLHTAILPHHTLWESFFRGLDYVVIDEIHAYRGVFGSHVANVIRRLKRIAAFYGNNPRFILTSATIANPAEHGKAMTGEDLVVIDRDGAPHGKKTIILYNPPVVHAETGIRKSATSEVIHLAGNLLDKRIQVLIFGRSRRVLKCYSGNYGSNRTTIRQSIMLTVLDTWPKTDGESKVIFEQAN
jgi:DEAD/DEAH box helicase domain-containing protein